MTTEIVTAPAADETAPALLDGGEGLMMAMAALVLIGAVVIVLMLS